ncbi:N2,N2-dimethylguanosine tRNA methyltransferase [Thermogladius sp. 4427co]|uniref:N2,N2-dimethylguanosine tRNA methyltransferase n=1 Tax=Thermogladius sp. 4427co TaxID=3450718 RepID=UPI003F79589D
MIIKESIIVEEGLAKIYIPNPSKYVREDGVVEPAWMPVFYNPEARFSRDITILALLAFFDGKSFYFVDLLAGTGVRGIRIALETGGQGIVNDVDPRAYGYLVENIRYNRVENKVVAANMEANALSNLLTFTGLFVDYMDIDPYGSPIPFIDNAIKPLGKTALLGVTATDKGPLTCVHKEKALKRYWIECANIDFGNELGIRLLTYNIALRASSQNLTIKPILYLSKSHYYRMFYVVERKNPSKTLSECKGFIWYCPQTLERGFTRNVPGSVSCSDGSTPLFIGPVWICPVASIEFVSKLEEKLGKADWLKNKDVINYIRYMKEESIVNEPYVRLDLLCKKYKVNMPKIPSLIEKIRSLGYIAARTHLDPRGIKTNAPIRELEKLLYNKDFN